MSVLQDDICERRRLLKREDSNRRTLALQAITAEFRPKFDELIAECAAIGHVEDPGSEQTNFLGTSSSWRCKFCGGLTRLEHYPLPDEGDTL